MYESFHKILKEICEEKNIKMTLLSKEWITMLEKKEKVKLIFGYKFDLNSQALGNTLDDKYATYELLTSLNIPVVEHKIVYSSNNKNEYAKDSNSFEIVEKYFNENNKNIVVKANNGTCGKQVYHIDELAQLKPCLDKLFLRNLSVSICPYYDIVTEYRLIMLKKEVELLYGKVRPIVFGDGKSTLKELLLKFNKPYFSNEEVLSKINTNYIPKKNEKYEYNWQFNLSGGASIDLDISYDIKTNLISLAKDVANKIGLEFGSIDIIRTKDNKLRILEINSGVMMANLINILPNGKNVAKDIYQKAVVEMFK